MEVMEVLTGRPVGMYLLGPFASNSCTSKGPGQRPLGAQPQLEDGTLPHMKLAWGGLMRLLLCGCCCVFTTHGLRAVPVPPVVHAGCWCALP